MTTTTTDPDPTGDPAESHPTDAPTSALAAHPDNPRRALGDLTELVRSIKAHGVLQPLLVLPANDDGIHLIVAGHRRHAAALRANLDRLPITVRDLSETDVIEAMLIENTSRNDLTVRDEVSAIAKLISFDGGLTPSKLCKRIGKSQRWVRDRMTITVLPARWLDALDDSQLTLAQAVAAAGCADLGPDHLDAVCAELANNGSWDHDPARTVDRYRRKVKLDADEAAAVAKLTARNVVYSTGDNPPPQSAQSLVQLGIEDRTHRTRPCHAVYVRRESWSDRLTLTGYCTNPKLHRQPSVGTADSPVASTGALAERDRTDDPHVKRRARLGRLAAATEMFARRRGGPTSSELMVLALQSFIDHAGHDVAKFAATILGLDTERPFQALAAHASTGAAGLAQTAGAVACGIAEIEAYHSTRHGVVAWYQLLTDHGWQPDDWTATRLTRAATIAAGDQPDTDTPDQNDPEEIDPDDGASGDEEDVADPADSETVRE